MLDCFKVKYMPFFFDFPLYDLHMINVVLRIKLAAERSRVQLPVRTGLRITAIYLHLSMSSIILHRPKVDNVLFSAI